MIPLAAASAKIPMLAILVLLLGTPLVQAATEAGFPWLQKAPPLPPSNRDVIRVASVDELLAAAERAEPGRTILLADGHYKLPRPMVLRQRKELTIRGASGDPTKVTLTGRGWESNDKGEAMSGH